jgi:FtsP/CotA-like multicopper oxidase with cupredoxin domain
LQGNANAGKDNKLEQAVQIKSDSKDISVTKETKSSDATKGDQKTNDNEVKKNAEAQKDDNQGASADGADAERDNEIYTVNGKAFDYMIHPISIQAGKPYRIYLVNMLEFDLVNSFHMHGNMYNYTIAGTEETPNFITDLVTLAQGDRGVIEFKYDYPGKYMFHAHQTEFTDLGWMGLFDVKPATPANIT